MRDRVDAQIEVYDNGPVGYAVVQRCLASLREVLGVADELRATGNDDAADDIEAAIARRLL